MCERQPVATFEYERGQLEDVLEFLKRTRAELRELRKVRVWTDHVEVFDVNGDHFAIAGRGYPDEDIASLLQAIGTNFKPNQIHNPNARPYKEFQTGRRLPWAAARYL